MEGKIYTEDILNRKYKNTNTERKRRNGYKQSIERKKRQTENKYKKEKCMTEKGK